MGANLKWSGVSLLATVALAFGAKGMIYIC